MMIFGVYCKPTSVMSTRFQPNDEEKEMYKNYKEDKGMLQNADKFLMKVRTCTHAGLDTTAFVLGACPHGCIT